MRLWETAMKHLVFFLVVWAIVAVAIAADYTPRKWTTETTPALDWSTQDDSAASTQVVRINRTGEHIDSIEVWPPLGVNVTIHRNGKPDVVLLNRDEDVEREPARYGR
jgi:hypothetical protein